MSAAEHTQGAGAANAFDKYTSDKTGIAAGLSKGHVVVKYTAKSKTRSRSLKKNDKTLAARQIAREVMGLAPYEKRLLDVLKSGAGNVEKRMYKMGKKRLGTHRRALKKRDEIKDYWAKVRQANN
jgi:large subunit ribosomal protein L36e|tara:strand:+ start:48 stop:422 length:375 start_codon:yes stop_codon:yes gene_type:complete